MQTCHSECGAATPFAVPAFAADCVPALDQPTDASAVTGQLAINRPILFAPVLDHDMNMVRGTFQDAAGLARQDIRQFTLLLDRAAFVHFHTNDGHGVVLQSDKSTMPQDEFPRQVGRQAYASLFSFVQPAAAFVRATAALRFRNCERSVLSNQHQQGKQQ
jgi:hypothetical protein